MTKFRLYFDKDEKTIWLNQMVQEGWAMKSFFAGFYNFERCEPGEYMYQVDFGDKLFKVSDEYREFMQDTGVEVVQPWGYWIILRKLASEGDFQLYTDVDSSIEHYSKIRRMFKGIIIIEMICLMMELFSVINGYELGYAFAFLIGALIFALINVVNKINKVIAELKERKGEEAATFGKGVSPFLPCGLLINSCALVTTEEAFGPLKMILHIVAIVMMCIGLYQTGKNRRKNF